MPQNSAMISVTPAACISVALSTLLLPLDWVCAWLIAVAFHELCHILIVKIFKCDIYSICFTLSGAAITTEPMTTKQTVISALAGPCGGFLLMSTFRWFPQLAICGCMQSIYNLLPLAGLDGGRALHTITLYFFPQRKAQRICKTTDRITRLVLFVVGLWTAWKLRWFALAIFCIILFISKRHGKIPCKQPVQRVQYEQMYN